jgi:hypothetical protein
MGSTSEYLARERQATAYQRYLDGYQKQLQEKLRLRFTKVDLNFRGDKLDVTFQIPGLVIQVSPLGKLSGSIPINRVVVKLSETLKGNLGEQRKEIRSSSKTEQVNLDRVVDQVFATYQLVESLYRYRKNVKDLVWPIFGLDPREVEDYRETKYQGRDLCIGIKWDTSYSSGSETCCVGVELREPQRDPYDHGRKLTWLFEEDGPADLEMNIALFKQKIQKCLQEWNQEEREALDRAIRKQNNEAVVTRLQRQYLDVDLDCVSMEANADNIRLSVWFNTEEDMVAMLEWIRKHRMGKGDDVA